MSNLKKQGLSKSKYFFLPHLFQIDWNRQTRKRTIRCKPCFPLKENSMRTAIMSLTLGLFWMIRVATLIIKIILEQMGETIRFRTKRSECIRSAVISHIMWQANSLFILANYCLLSNQTLLSNRKNKSLQLLLTFPIPFRGEIFRYPKTMIQSIWVI